MIARPQDRMPSFAERKLDFPIAPNYIATNASVVVFGNTRRDIYALVPAMDHYVDQRGSFMPLPVGSPEPRHHLAHNITYLARLNDDLSVADYVKLTLPEDQVPKTKWEFRGFESPRLFAWNGFLWMTLCTHGNYRCEGAEFYIGRITPDYKFADVRKIAPPMPKQNEKNWMPDLEGSFHYCPGTMIDGAGNLTRLGNDDYAHMHGGSQVIPYKDGKLCVVHGYDGSVDKSYQHFMRMDNDGKPLAISEPFNLHRDITTGMAYHPDGKRMILSYGRQDAESNVLQRQEKPYLATVDLAELEGVI